MATFAEIKARVRTHLIDVSDATEAEIPGWVNRAIRFACEAHNFRFMEATAAFTTASTGSIATKRALGDLPSDWKEKRAAPWLQEGDGGTREIMWAASESDILRLYNEEYESEIGAPCHILETDTDLKVYPFPNGASLYADGEYRVKVPYWKFLADLSADGDTNWFTLNAGDYVTWKATAEGMLFNREEERGSLWAVKAGEFDANSGRFTGELARLVRKDKRSRLAKRITLAPHRDVYASTMQRRSF